MPPQSAIAPSVTMTIRQSTASTTTRAGGPDEAGRRLGRRRALAEPPQAGDQQEQQQAGGDQRLHARVDPGAAGGGHQRGAGEAAEAPAGVQRGHDRPVQDALDGDAVGVHRDVHRAARRAEHDQRERQQPRLGRQQRERQHERAGQARQPRGAHAAEPHDRLAHDRQGADHADRHRQDHQAERALGEVEAILDPRDVADPGADHGAVHEEDAEGRHARRHARTTLTPAAA